MDMSKFDGGSHENVADWLLTYDQYRVAYGWSNDDYKTYLTITLSQDALQ